MNAAVTAMHCGIWGPKLGQKEMLYFLEPLKWTKLRRDAAAGDGATESSQLQLEAASRQHLLLRGWGSILLSEGGWFDSPGTFDTEPQTAPDVLVSHHQWVGLSQLLSVRTDSQSHHPPVRSNLSISEWSIAADSCSSDINTQTQKSENHQYFTVHTVSTWAMYDVLLQQLYM